MDGVPLKLPQGASEEVKEDVRVIVPDYLTILQETEVSVFVSVQCVKHTLSSVTVMTVLIETEQHNLVRQIKSDLMFFQRH